MIKNDENPLQSIANFIVQWEIVKSLKLLNLNIKLPLATEKSEKSYKYFENKFYGYIYEESRQ